MLFEPAAPKPRSIICLNAYGIASVAPAATSSAMPASTNWRLYGERKGSSPLRVARLLLRGVAGGVGGSDMRQLSVNLRHHDRRLRKGRTMRKRHWELHRTGRIGWLRAAVLGANDGIVSTASLVLGVAAAHASHSAVIVAGMAGAVGGANLVGPGGEVSVHFPARHAKGDGHPPPQEAR